MVALPLCVILVSTKVGRIMRLEPASPMVNCGNTPCTTFPFPKLRDGDVNVRRCGRGSGRRSLLGYSESYRLGVRQSTVAFGARLGFQSKGARKQCVTSFRAGS